MKSQLTVPLAIAVLVAIHAPALAHHSFAMFDQAHPIEIECVVHEFKYTNPHSYLLVLVKGADGSTVLWNLEGQAPSLLTREGWTSRTLKPGDELRLIVEPLHSGAPGGTWNVNKIKFKDGRPIVPVQ